MLCKVTHCAGCVSANTRPHQLRWGDREMGTAIISCVPHPPTHPHTHTHTCTHKHTNSHGHTHKLAWAHAHTHTHTHAHTTFQLRAYPKMAINIVEQRATTKSACLAVSSFMLQCENSLKQSNQFCPPVRKIAQGILPHTEFRCYEAKVEVNEKAGGLVVVRLSWLSGRALAAQARGVQGSTPSNCQSFHFPLFSPHNI